MAFMFTYMVCVLKIKRGVITRKCHHSAQQIDTALFMCNSIYNSIMLSDEESNCFSILFEIMVLKQP